jgi:hypothetical protein
MNKLKRTLLSLGLLLGCGFALIPIPVGASVLTDACDADPNSVVCQQSGKQATDYIKIIINTLLFILGAVAVVMIIVGGIRYTTSGGDEKNVVAAKNTILYSVIGLVVASLAFAIVNFVIGRIG